MSVNLEWLKSNPQAVYMDKIAGLRSPLRDWAGNMFNNYYQKYLGELAKQSSNTRFEAQNKAWREQNMANFADAFRKGGLSEYDYAQAVGNLGTGPYKQETPKLQFGDWLKNINFLQDYYSKSPYERGDYPNRLAPRTRFLNY